MTLWVDYSAGQPGGAALKAAGITGAIRYVGTPGRAKNITAAEYADLIAHGIAVLLVHENVTGDVLRGSSGGVMDAQASQADARNCGIPESVGIASSADQHLTAAQVTASLDYQAGFHSVLGARTGAYGFGEFVDAVRAAGTASWFWKAGSAPSTDERAWVTFWQRNAGTTTQTINRIICDLSDQLNPISEGVLTMAIELTDGVPVPILDSNGMYVSDGPDAQVRDLLRFSDASTRWLVEKWVPYANGLLTQLTAAVAALQAVQAPTELTGSATVTVSLAPKLPAA